MAVPLQIDLDRLRAGLGEWLAARPTGVGEGAGRWELGEATVPEFQGLSQETVLIGAFRVGPGGRWAARPLVVKLAPRRFRLYPWDRFAAQCRLVDLLGRRTDVPVAPVYGYELDPGVLGVPFLVLGFVDGDVPPDIPPYHMHGFMREMAPDARARLWDAALVAMAGVHRLDPEPLGLGFVDQPEYGPAGSAQQVAAYERHLEFFEVDPAAAGVVGAALRWLHDHRPVERYPVRLLWGDARLGNIIFRGARVAAVLDWEMVTLGQPEVDLAWFLHLDRHLSEGVGGPRLAGLPDRAATVARYGQLLGRPVENVDYYAVLAAVRHALLAARLTGLIIQYGLLPPGVDLPLGAMAAGMLTRVLDEAGGTVPVR